MENVATKPSHKVPVKYNRIYVSVAILAHKYNFINNYPGLGHCSSSYVQTVHFVSMMMCGSGHAEVLCFIVNKDS